MSKSAAVGCADGRVTKFFATANMDGDRLLGRSVAALPFVLEKVIAQNPDLQDIYLSPHSDCAFLGKRLLGLLNGTAEPADEREESLITIYKAHGATPSITLEQLGALHLTVVEQLARNIVNGRPYEYVPPQGTEDPCRIRVIPMHIETEEVFNPEESHLDKTIIVMNISPFNYVPAMLEINSRAQEEGLRELTNPYVLRGVDPMDIQSDLIALQRLGVTDVRYFATSPEESARFAFFDMLVGERIGRLKSRGLFPDDVELPGAKFYAGDPAKILQQHERGSHRTVHH